MKRKIGLILGVLLPTLSLASVNTEPWQYVKTIDGFTDSLITSAVTIKKDATAIAVRCREAKLDVVLNMNRYIDKNSAVVQWRLDKNEVKYGIWDASTNGRSFFASQNSTSEIIQALKTGNKILVGVHKPNGQRYDKEFFLKGSKKAIEKVEKDCL